MESTSGNQALLKQIRLRYGWTIVSANFFGGVIVFLLLVFLLPNPPEVRHPDTVRLLSLISFVVVSLITFPTAWKISQRNWESTLGWITEGRGPTDAERRLTLRFPLAQQKINVVIWLTIAILFTALTAPFSVELAGNVFETIILGGIVTCSLGFLGTERQLRPIMALALADGPPSKPQLPGVAARTMLTWILGTGVVLIGTATVGVGALSETRFTRERLAVVLIVLGVLGLVVGALTMVGLARSLADPIDALRRAVSRVEQGDLDQEVTVDDGSEVGLLQAGFNRMLAGLRERERIRDLFGRQVGEDVVRVALEQGVELGGEAREAAVLFVDLEGSTRLAETQDPADVVALLNRFFAVVVDVVSGQGGWVNKFEGDAALCVFGAPLPDRDAATRALVAARTLRDRLDRELGEVNAGIGVSAGRVVAGNIGAAKRFEYTVIGDPVNEAARLTELAKSAPERVLASDAALRQASEGERLRWQLGEEIELRGRQAATRVAVPASRRAARVSS